MSHSPHCQVSTHLYQKYIVDAKGVESVMGVVKHVIQSRGLTHLLTKNDEL